ncbi:MAG: hypothetical protein J6O56_04920 [Bacilli bacterium]|nr:hypothetical protein [Bacilli bacterium]
MKVEMNREREYLNHIYNMVYDKNFDVAKKRINDLRKNRDFHIYSFEIDYLEAYLKEQISLYGEKNELIEEYLSAGRDSLYYDNLDEALDYFSAGAYTTEHPLFDYMIGKTLYMTQDRKDEGVKYLEKYINESGGSKAYKAYDMLGEYYYYLDIGKSKKYQKKKDKVMLVTSTNYVRKDKNVIFKEIKEVEELGKNKKIEELYEKFNNSSDEIKLRIIGELYKRAYRKQADTLYKKNKREIEKHSKNSRRLVRELDANKTLYINKGKHNVNG